MGNLTWNDFSASAVETIRRLIEDKESADVTLVCNDNKQISAHKVVLSSCSNFFKKVLKNNPHKHPLIYLKGVEFLNLQSIVKFMYLGQAEVEQNNLEDFMDVAQELEISGLSESISGTKRSDIKNEMGWGTSSFDSEQKIETIGDQLEEKPPANNYNADVMVSHNTLVQTDEISLVSDITPSPGNYRCQYCSYSSKSNYNVKRHVMSVHEGVTYPCTFCGYKATQTTHLKSHIAKVHSKIF